ncbi:MAG: hypothetical protein HY073_04220 [Deltaproteobacteria bacterium]|nr:hypothetical protein [Deltaproteobacteria bacterium]
MREVPTKSTPTASPKADHQKERQQSSFIKSIVDKTKKDLLEWYPPFFLHAHPEIREGLSKISPTVKAALDIEEKVFETAKNIFQNNKGNQLAAQTPAINGPVKGQLFVDGPAFDDIRQGTLGDCYFVSSLSAIADVDPQFIRDSVKINPDNTFSVRFFQNGKPVYVTVNNDFIHSPSGQLAYASSTDKGELWVAVMEKAYAQWRGGYQTIGKGGDPAKALAELTGVKSRAVLDGQISTEALYSNLQKALQNHEPVVAGTYPGPQNEYKQEGLVNSHAYTVIGVKEDLGQKYVVLRNPWGQVEWNGPGADKKNDGIFEMPIQDFQKMFDIVDYSRSSLLTAQK